MRFVARVVIPRAELDAAEAAEAEAKADPSKAAKALFSARAEHLAAFGAGERMAVATFGAAEKAAALASPVPEPMAPRTRVTFADAEAALKAEEALLTPAEKSTLAAERAAAEAKFFKQCERMANPFADLLRDPFEKLKGAAMAGSVAQQLAPVLDILAKEKALAHVGPTLDYYSRAFDPMYEIHRQWAAEELRARVLRIRLSWQHSPTARAVRRSRAIRRTSGNSSPPSDDGDGPAPSAEQQPCCRPLTAFPVFVLPPFPDRSIFSQALTGPCAPVCAAGGAAVHKRSKREP